MKFVQIGREVVPRELSKRQHKAVITGIKNEKFIVIMKQDKTYEYLRTEDVVLTDNVYTEEELKSSSCKFYKLEEEKMQPNDFERFKMGLEKRIAEDLLREKGVY